MANVRVTAKIDFRKFNKEFRKAISMDRVGRTIVKEIKRKYIGKGISPVNNVKRFEAYAVDRPEAKSDYPTGIKQKRPVNLELTGEFLRDYDFEAGKGELEIGFISPSSRTQELIKAHNDGDVSFIPRRQIVPDIGRGEKFKPAIMSSIRDLIADEIRKFLRRKK